MPEFKNDFSVLLNTVDRNLRHQDYDYVIAIAKEYTTFATGKGIDEMLIRFNGRETIELFQQRLALTIVNTMDILNSCVKPLYKVGRTPANIQMQWSGKDAKQTAENRKKITEVADKFWGEESVKKYLTKRLPDFDKTDPNAFFVVEFKERATPQNGIKVKPYPFEVKSCDAINYEYKDNVLQWLIVRNDFVMINDKGQAVDGEVLYAYFENRNVKVTQIHRSVIQAFKNNNPTAIIIDASIEYNDLAEDQLYIYETSQEGEAKRFYSVQIFEHNIGMVPAKRFGTMTDPTTNDRTCVPMIEPAKCYLEDSIQTMSEFSITKRLHTFPQKIQYLPKCMGEPNKGCNKGFAGDGRVCGACNGTGTITHSSSQDIIGIVMPDDMKDLVSLENIMVYKGPPIDLVKFQKEFGFDDLKRYAISAVYNGASLAKTKIVKTATEAELDLDSTYDTLTPFADHFSECDAFIMKCIASLRDMQEGFEYSHQFPSDFGMEPLDYLLAMLAQANTSGAASYIKKFLNTKITKKILADQPREFLKVETKDKFLPFPGKTETEVQYILANDLTTKYNKALYAHFDLLFSELEFDFGLKNIDFYELNEVIQRAAIKGKVNAILAELENQDAASAAAAFGGIAPEEVENEAKANLRGSAAGVQGLISIQNSVSVGTTDYQSGLNMLYEIYGYDETTAKKLLGNPKPQPTTLKPAIPVLN